MNKPQPLPPRNPQARAEDEELGSDLVIRAGAGARRGAAGSAWDGRLPATEGSWPWRGALQAWRGWGAASGWVLEERGTFASGSLKRQPQKEVNHTKGARRQQGEPNATF